MRWPWDPPVTWTWCGTVEGITNWLDADGNETGSQMRGYWVLSEGSDGTRRAKLVGDPGKSPFALHRLAAVEAWLIGGPVPPLDSQPVPNPRPRKTEPEPEPVHADNVVPFPRKS